MELCEGAVLSVLGDTCNVFLWKSIEAQSG